MKPMNKLSTSYGGRCFSTPWNKHPPCVTPGGAYSAHGHGHCSDLAPPFVTSRMLQGWSSEVRSLKPSSALSLAFTRSASSGDLWRNPLFPLFPSECRYVGYDVTMVKPRRTLTEEQARPFVAYYSRNAKMLYTFREFLTLGTTRGPVEVKVYSSGVKRLTERGPAPALQGYKPNGNGFAAHGHSKDAAPHAFSVDAAILALLKLIRFEDPCSLMTLELRRYAPRNLFRIFDTAGQHSQICSADSSSSPQSLHSSV
ncbi:hypothetical protein J6590_037937 [Homalodisca vitripennis]|nr:hypothetical protein J6590_037937 [Homalodisca vitripennis]